MELLEFENNFNSSIFMPYTTDDKHVIISYVYMIGIPIKNLVIWLNKIFFIQFIYVNIGFNLRYKLKIELSLWR